MGFKTLAEIREIAKTPRNKAKIPAARNHEKRLRLHGQAALSSYGTSANVDEFLMWVKKLIPHDKYKIFLSLFRYPVKTTGLTDKIYMALEKVFEGVNPVHKYLFTSPTFADDWEEFRTSKLDEPNVWQTKGFEAMKTAINSMLVIDLPAQQSSERPEPYMYFLDLESVIDYEFNQAKKCIDWAMFHTKGADGKKLVAIFCDEFYRVVDLKNNDLTKLSEADLVSETRHDLEECPVSFFWETPFNYHKDCDLKLSPITGQLSNLDWLLFYLISKRHLDTYASYPIYSGFTQDCDYRNVFNDDEEGEQGEYCADGYLRSIHSDGFIHMNGALKECPACSRSKLAGAGSFIEVSPPSPENEKADLRNPVQVIEAPIDSLNYNVEEIGRLESEIYQAVTGYGGEPINNAAINEKQVIASFESRQKVINSIKKNFENAQKWATNTVCKLRYGANYKGCSISYGTEFYLHSENELLELYDLAKNKVKAAPFILDMLDDQYTRTKYRNNQEQLLRANILNHLDPFRHLSTEQVGMMYGAGQLKYEDYFLKSNFSSLIMRFERENTTVTEFGAMVDFNTRINNIKAALISYIEVIEPPKEVEPVSI